VNHVARIRKGRKFDQVLDGARSVFMADGYEGSSVDDIARAAGVSKATLYSYFPDKSLLFVEVATRECLRQSREILDSIDMEKPPRDVLREGGRQFLRFVTSPFGLQMFRICIAEKERFPEIGREFYRSGPQNSQRELMRYFELATARGELKIDDPQLAACQFAELCKADIWTRRTFNMIDTVSDADIDRVIDGAVDLFLARYGT
jgi:AcrR family transcriptional regulator